MVTAEAVESVENIPAEAVESVSEETAKAGKRKSARKKA